MSKEIYNQIIDEAYENYKLENKKTNGTEVKVLSKYDDVDELVEETLTSYTISMSKEQFINKCKTDNEFSERWGLNIDERELSLQERYSMVSRITDKKTPTDLEGKEWIVVDNIPYKIPTKLITIIYNNEKIESYE